MKKRNKPDAVPAPGAVGGSGLARLRTIAGGSKKTYSRIAEYILENYKDVPGLNISELSERIGTSTATVSRFSVYAGYKNYHAFKVDMAASAVNNSAVSDIFVREDRPSTILKRVFEMNCISLRDTELLIDVPGFSSVARRVTGARRVVFYGVGSSGLVGKLGAIRFEGLGISTMGITDPYEGLLVISSMDKRDVFIGVSHSGRSKSTLDLTRLAKKRGAYTIAVTNYSDSPLAKISRKTVFTVFRERKVNAAVSYSGISQICVIDALYFLAAHFQGGTFENMAEQYERDAESLLRIPADKNFTEEK